MEMASKEDIRFAKWVVEERQRVTEHEIKEARRVKDYETGQEATVTSLEAEEVREYEERSDAQRRHGHLFL